MATVQLVDTAKKVKETVDLPEGIFGTDVKIPLMHHVVVAQLAARRAGTHQTKTRKDVQGSTRKLFKQKGTGNARQGSLRSPVHKGGGVVFGPHPRSYETKVNKKEMKAALRSALSVKAIEGKLILVTDLDLVEPKTKVFLDFANTLGLTDALFVTDAPCRNLTLGHRNISGFKSLLVAGLNVYDVLSYDQLVITKPAYEKICEVFAR